MTDDLIERIRVQFEEIQGPVLGPPERLEAIKARRDDALRDFACAAIAECFKWRDINDAPRDGTTILACWPQQGNLMMLVWYSSAHGFWLRTGREPVIPMQATHWIPLPDPPKEFAP